MLLQVGSCHHTCACATQMSLLEPSLPPQLPLAALAWAWYAAFASSSYNTANANPPFCLLHVLITQSLQHADSAEALLSIWCCHNSSVFASYQQC